MGEISLSPTERRIQFQLSRRDFLSRFSQIVGAAFIPAGLWGFAVPSAPLLAAESAASGETAYLLQPRYLADRPLDAVLLKVRPELDRFPTEVYADRIGEILSRWSASLRNSLRDLQPMAKSFSANFSGASLRPVESHVARVSSALHVHKNVFTSNATLNPDAFLRDWQSALQAFSAIDIAEFQITNIGTAAPSGTNNPPKKDLPMQVDTRIRYEIVGSGQGFYRDQRVGNWHMVWELSDSGEFRVAQWRVLDETQARSASPTYVDITAAAIGSSSSYAAQLAHGTDYWRTVLDGACGIDIYGHNGVSVADIDDDGFDDLYVCQAAGLPNRLYRNRGDGTFEDITESSGLGILENTVCALFADFDNDGRQDVILVRNNGPLLFLNQGGGRFQQKPDAFQFASPPRGTFTGASVADYDRDGWLDVYFSLYSYYQGNGQYKYPSPYHDAENGPPNFMMRNNRRGTFRDVTAVSGLDKNNTRYSFCCGWGDFDRDGWPDLYVVNDFGRKNLYRNNGDGTFTDVAAQEGVEDVGAGMSVCWFDYDNDSAEDLYVSNMWTAAGVRVSMLDAFKPDSTPEIRALYQKHAMGNSLQHNRSARFDDATHAAGVGIGRWAWSADSFDFDHDGFLDLYVVNGMVSGPSRYDLNSYFWRQVVAYSPDEAGSSHNYEQGWNAINELIRSDGSWSGYERNMLYANNGDGTFSDVSAAVGLDFIQDGRSFALSDFDHDGRLEIFLKSRNAPQLRVLKNVVLDLPPSIAFRLKGTKSNRDAIGASVTIEASSGKQTRMLQAGSGFLCQHSKDLFFALGDTKGTVNATIRWPSGLVQQLKDLPINHRIWLGEGSDPSRVELLRPVAAQKYEMRRPEQPEQLPTRVETWLLAPVPAPDFSLPDLSGHTQSISGCKGNPVLLSFGTTKSQDCRDNLGVLDKNQSRWLAQGLQTLCINVDHLSVASAQAERSENDSLDAFLRQRRVSVPILRASDDVAAVYNILYRQLFDRHRDLTLPTSFLINADGYIVKVYQGVADPEHVAQDFRQIPRTDAERLARALPFPSKQYSLEFGRNHLSTGALFFQRGYLDQAAVAFEQALHDDPTSAEAVYGIGSVYLNQNKNAAAREMFEHCVKLQPTYPDTLPDAWNNLGVLATRENRVDQAIRDFQQAVKVNPRHLLSLDNLGNAFRLEKRWDDARAVLERAIAVAPEDPEANYSLGMVFAQNGDTDRAYEYLQRALKARPAYPEALNNLGVLYLVTNRRDQAVATFEQCIQVAPTFDQAYLNLARVYAIEGARDKARGLLLDLLKHHPDHPGAKQMLDQLQQ